MQLSLETWQFWLDVAVRLVGVIFLWTGMIKAIAPRNFQQHLGSLGLFPYGWLQWIVAAVAGVELGLGAALLLEVGLHVMIPGTLVLLVVLSTISVWGVQSGKTADCGCYGGYIQPSIWQSVGLNIAFAASLLGYFIFIEKPDDWSTWKVAIAVALGIAGFAFVVFARAYEQTHARPLIETNPLKVGARWRTSWSGGVKLAPDEESMVVFLGPDCPFCHQWVRFLNAISAAPSLPRVVGAMGASKSRRDTFIQEQRIKFPTVTVSPSLVSRLAPGVPTTVLVAKGRVEAIWMGAMPPAFYNRFKEAFFPNRSVSAEPRDDPQPTPT
jgi:hypothetical protein